MSPRTPDIDAAQLLDAAVRERMLEPGAARELRKKLGRGDPVRALTESGRLTTIQCEALLGLLRPRSVADGFEVVGLLGYGGIGVVYRAVQPQLDRAVALKAIATDRLAAPSAAARFQQEARAIARLQHPNIVTAYDFGPGAAAGPPGRFYLAMELVDGVDLDDHIRRSQTLDEPLAWRIVRQVASALAHALDSGIVHRDIKPGNLLLTRPPAGYPLPDGVPLVKVTDFGLAQLRTGASEPATRLTVTGATMGTPNYMAPEQINDAKVDHRADIYALGATAFHMLTGAPPYAGESLVKVVTSKLAGDSGPLERLSGELSEASQELLRSMMAPEPEDRPATYADLLERVGRVLASPAVGGKPLDSRLVLQSTWSSGAFRNTPSVQDADTVLSRSAIRPAPSRRALLAGGAAAGLMVGGGWWWLAANRGEASPRWRPGQPRRPVPRVLGFAPNEWSYTSGNGEEVLAAEGESPYVGYTRFDGGIRWRLRRSPEWREIGRPEHFGLSLRLALGDAESVVVSLRWAPDAAVGELRLRVLGDRATFGRVGEGAPSSLPYDPSDNRREMTLDLHRDDGRWFAFRTDRRTEQVGSAPFRATAPPDELHLTASGGRAYLGEVSLYALEKRADA